MHNLNDVVKIIDQCKLQIKANITKKVPAKKRPMFYLLFIDLAKAFDSINRNKLIKTMQSRNVNPSLVKAFTNMLQSTSMLIDGKLVSTNKGVM